MKTMRVRNYLLSVLACCLVAIPAGAVAGGPNLLTNPGFEDLGGSYNGWFTFGSGVQLSTPSTDNIARTDTVASKVFGEFTGCPTEVFDVGGYGQAFTPVVGNLYTFSGYSFVSSADPIPGTSTCDGNRLIAKIVFFNAVSGGTELQSNEIVLGNWESVQDEWVHFSISSPAPTGALRVEALILYLQPGCDTGSVFVDDLEFCEESIPANGNVLANGSFSSGSLANWNTFGNVYADARVFAKRTLPAAAKMFSTFTPDSPSGMFQIFPTTPGTAWSFSGYGMTTCVEDPIDDAVDHFVLLRLEFKDSGGAVIGGGDWGLVNNQYSLGTWHYGQVQGVAPAGTDSVAAYVLYVSPNFDGVNAAAFVDDFVLEQVSATGVPEGRTQNFQLFQNAPNPMRASTRIAFNLDEPDQVQVKVFDVNGRLVADLYSGSLPAGPHSVTWDGMTTMGHRAATGMYRYVLSTSTGRSARSILLQK